MARARTRKKEKDKTWKPKTYGNDNEECIPVTKA